MFSMNCSERNHIRSQAFAQTRSKHVICMKANGAKSDPSSSGTTSTVRRKKYWQRLSLNLFSYVLQTFTPYSPYYCLILSLSSTPCQSSHFIFTVYGNWTYIPLTYFTHDILHKSGTNISSTLIKSNNFIKLAPVKKLDTQ